MELEPKFEKSGNGMETVTLTRAEFDWLIEQAEDAADLAAAYEGLKSLKEDGAIPAEIARAVRNGKHPIAAARAYRKMTQVDLAGLIGVTQAAIARLEASAPGTGRTETIDSITEALALPRWFFEPRADERSGEKLGRKVYKASANPILDAAPHNAASMSSPMVRDGDSGNFVAEPDGKTVRKRGAAATKSKGS